MTLISTTDSRWTDALAALPHDVYHLPEYTALCARHDGGEPVAFYYARDGHVLLSPLILRSIAGSALRDAISPYGYPGPLTNGPEPFVRDALAAMVAEMHDVTIVSIFVRLHTLLPIPLAPFIAAGAIVTHGSTVSIDLTLDEETIERQMRENHRRDIQRAVRLGGFAASDPGWSELPAFIRVYTQTMRRVNADGAYFFTAAYFEDLRDRLRGHTHLFVYRLRGRVAAAAIVTEVGGTVQYHLGGTADEHANEQPLKPLLWAIALWARECGDRTFHLGGGRSASTDSLLHYKEGFSPRSHAFRTWRVVTDAEGYERLSRVWAESRARTPEPPDGFFPAYRA